MKTKTENRVVECVAKKIFSMEVIFEVKTINRVAKALVLNTIASQIHQPLLLGYRLFFAVAVAVVAIQFMMAFFRFPSICHCFRCANFDVYNDQKVIFESKIANIQNNINV